MKTKLNKHSVVLPLLLPVMLALTSCSTVSQHQSVSAVAGGVVAPHHQVHKQTHQPTRHHVASQGQHSIKVSSTHQQPYHPVHVSHHPENPIVMPLPQPKTVKPVMHDTVSAPVVYTQANPVYGQSWLLNVQGIDLKPGTYKNMGRSQAIIVNISRLDHLDGRRHYIQAARWDGEHVSQSYINATQAEIMAMVGLGILENGYVETNFGTTIMMLGGNGHIIDIPGHHFELVVTRAARVTNPKSHQTMPGTGADGNRKPAKLNKPKSATKHQGMSMLDNYDFTIGENEVVSVLDQKLSQMAESTSEDNEMSASVVSSVSLPANPEHRASRHCSSADISGMSEMLCSLNEANNNISVMQSVQDNKLFCHHEMPVAPPMVSVDFGSHTLSANTNYSNANIE